jgi:glycosyltransferase involved in cell wall biosynthesis
MSEPIRVVNCAELAQAGWTFLKDSMPTSNLAWSFHTASPRNWIERLVKRPKIARYRAAANAALDAGNADIVISHLPRMTWWVALFGRLFSIKARHIAFSFNFTDLPTGFSHRLMSGAFRYVDRFVVFSSAEKSLYSEYFGIDPDRIDVLPWAMKTPDVQPEAPLVEGDYICAMGGEGRDYKTLVDACRALHDIPLVLAVRPQNIAGMEMPAHIKAYTNLPNSQFWNIVKFSRFVVIPLRDETTNCGHISIVGSMLFGKPVVSTLSSGTQEYVRHEQNALVSEPGDVEGLRKNIELMWQDHDLSERLARGASELAAQHDEGRWVDYLVGQLAAGGERR